MERFPKLFILAAIGYLLVGVLLGIYQGIGAYDPAVTRFVHIHLNLLGFMAMFIYGVAYHILPRFNAKPITNPALIPVHFYLVNAGLIGMSLFAMFNGLHSEGIAHYGFIISSIVESTGIFIFAYNLIPVILPEKEVETAAEPDQKYIPAVTADMKVTETLDKWPGLIEVFADNGFKALTNPAARETFAKTVTIKQACKIHKVNESEFLGEVNSFIENGGATGETKTAEGGGSKPAPTPAPAPASIPASAPEKTAETAAGKGKTIARGDLVEADTLIGSLLEVYPETKPVFEKNYGEGCFSCPGQAFETVAQTAMMHGLKTEKILDEINEIIESALTAAK
jgi:hybrid cluster-associated redox disulfide protein